MGLSNKEILNMTFQEAITAVNSGSTVKRSTWSGKTIKQVTDENDNVNIQVTQMKTIKAPYLANRDDMYATDWTTV